MATENKLSYLDNAERLKAYEFITNGCMHLWSKNKLMDGKTCPHCGQATPKVYKNGRQCGQLVDKKGKVIPHETPDRLTPILKAFSELADKDPLFLAHFTSYAMRKLDSKDLKVVATFANSLSDADGTPFSAGSAYKKPNWRLVSQAAFQMLEPKLALRVLELSNLKMPFGSKQTGSHRSKHIKTANKKYLRYRESNPKSLEGIKKAGLTGIVKTMYRTGRVAPSPEAVGILGWKQKPGFPGSNVEIKKSDLFNFKGMSDLDIAEKIRKGKLSALPVLGALPGKLSPVVAAAILEQASGDQAVILTDMFEEQGLLKEKEVKALYQEKIKTAKNALDRVERIRTEMDEETKQILKSAKSDKRKEDVGDFGKVFEHIDVSGSMHQAIQIAIDRGAIIAECIKNPKENFHWGVFNTAGKVLPRPTTFEKDAFAAGLYGIHPNGGTDCLALYIKARELGCTTDIYITDQDHNGPNIDLTVSKARRFGYPDPKMSIIIDVYNNQNGHLKRALEACGLPVVVLNPNQLRESALVSQAVRGALKGAEALIDEILEEPLLSLPKWWFAVQN